LKRTGPLRDRLAVRAMRLGAVAWGLGERFGIDLVGSTEGPSVNADPERRKVFDQLIAAAQEGDGTVPVAECPYPAHELLTHLVVQRGLLLHGSNNASLEVLEARPAHDLGTVLEAVVTSDDALWPMFYAVIERERVKALFTGCVHVGRSPRLRRFYFFAVDGDPADPGCWTDGVVYAMPRAGFRREWGREWVSPGPVRPSLRVPVRPDDFPLRASVLGAPREEFSQVFSRLRAAKRARAV
jgi:hypothetical protein